MKIILVAVLALSILCPIVAEDERPKYEPMDRAGIVQWYRTEVVKSILEDAQYMEYIAILTLSQSVPCFDIYISTEASYYGHPGWSVDPTNCVDKRTYQCEEE